MIYLDASALVKLVVEEDESAALRAWLAKHAGTPRVASDLARVEVTRVVMRYRPTGLLQAYQVIARVHKIGLTRQVLDTAAALQPPELRTLDALHLASALALGSHLTAFVGYDDRLSTAASDVGLPVHSPR